MSINRGMDEEVVVHIYNEILLSYKKRDDTGSSAERWMDLGTVIQNEVSQEEKNKYHMLTQICGI